VGERQRRSADRGAEQTILLCAMIGAAQITWGAVVPALPLYVAVVHAPVAVLGPLLAAFAIGRVLGNVPAGLLLRRWDPRAMLWVSLSALALVTIATAFASDLSVVFGLRLVAGILGGAAVTVGFAVVLAGAPDDRRGRVVSIATVVQMGAGAVGALLGGAAVSAAGPRAAFVVGALPVVLVLTWELVRPARGYWAALRGDGIAAAPASPPARGGSPSGLLAALAAVSFALFFARFAAEQGLIPVLAYDSASLDPLGLGAALAAGTVLSMAALPLVGRIVDRGARLAVLLPATAASALVLIAFGLLSEPGAFAASVVAYGVATSMANVVPGVVTAEAFPGRRAGGAVGLTRTAGDVGAAVGPLLVFWLADLATPAVALAAVAVVLVVAVAAFVLVLPRRTA